jgi:hypothetical protein
MNPVLSRPKTGYRRYGRDDTSPVFAPAPGTSRPAPAPAPVFFRKYENGRDETRERYGTVRDLSRPFSTLVADRCLRCEGASGAAKFESTRTRAEHNTGLREG